MALKEQQVVADDTEEITPEPELSLREQIVAARDEVIGRQQEETQTEPSSGRGADGRFTSQAPEKTGTVAKSIEPVTSTGTTTPPSVPVSEAPRSWKAEEKALWAKISPEAQAVINRREADVFKQISQSGQAAAFGNEFMQIAQEYAPVIQARGGNPQAMFRDFMRIMTQLHGAPDVQSRAAVFQQIAAQQGVDLRVLGIAPQGPVSGQQPTSPTQPPAVPIEALIQQGIDQRWNAWQTRQAQAAEQAEMQRYSGEIEAFKSKTNEQGQPLYPHFDKVTGLMASLISGGAASSLEEAYPLAVKVHPETSKLIEAEQQAAAKKAEEQRQAADKARRKAGSVRGSVGSAAPNGGGDRTLREELQAAFAESRGRV